jgi:hypothetical protein
MVQYIEIPIHTNQPNTPQILLELIVPVLARNILFKNSFTVIVIKYKNYPTNQYYYLFGQ